MVAHNVSCFLIDRVYPWRYYFFPSGVFFNLTTSLQVTIPNDEIGEAKALSVTNSIATTLASEKLAFIDVKQDEFWNIVKKIDVAPPICPPLLPENLSSPKPQKVLQ